MFVHGSSYYMKSVFQSGPQADITKSVFKRVCELNAAPGNEIEHSYVFKYLPLRVSLTVPEGATAFHRTDRCTTGLIWKWNRNTPSTEEVARRAARELTNIIAEAEAQVSGENNSGYGNFSQYLFSRFSLFRVVIEEPANALGSEAHAQTTVNGVQVLGDSNSRMLFGPNYSRLQRLKAQYDPENVFSKWFPIIPNPDA
jgi:hypothetical protein